MNKIKIITGNHVFQAEIFNTPTGNEILNNLPMKGLANIWGDEIYFTIPVNIDQERDARQVVEVGELAYWPIGSAFCIFFGPTPVSDDEKPKAYSPANVFGKLIDFDVADLKKVRNGEEIVVEVG